MEKIKKYLKPTIKWTIIIMLYFTIINIFVYNNMISFKSVKMINFIFTGMILLLIGFKKGKKAQKKGYLEGLKLGSIIVLVLFILNLILYRNLNLNLFMYYLVIIASPMIGSILGINIKH